MLKIGRRRWVMLTLALFLFMGAFLTTFKWLLPSPGYKQPVNASKSKCTGQHQNPYFGEDVVIDTTGVLCSNLTTFGGTVVVNGELKGDILAVGATIVIAGIVDGTIEVYGGSITLQDGSHIRGDIELYGGQWVKGANVQTDGSVVDHTKRIDWLFANQSFSFPFLSLLIWVGLGLILIRLLPEHVMIVRTTVVNKAKRSLLIGLLSILLAPLALVILIALILPIPLAIIVAIGLISAWAFGTVAVGWYVGEQVLQAIAPHRNTRSAQVAVGLTVLVLLGSLPYIGWLLNIGVGLLGLGAVFLSRFGTRFYSQPKKPLTL